MSAWPASIRLQTERLILRPRSARDAALYRQLWTERDPRVPAHRRIDVQGRPSVRDIADGIRRELHDERPGLLAVHRGSTGDIIGYCGLVFHGNGAPDEPELAYELLRHAQGAGYATEAGAVVLEWAEREGYDRVWATVRAWNTASRRVLFKLGFVQTGHSDPDAVHGDSLLTVRDHRAHPGGS